MSLAAWWVTRQQARQPVPDTAAELLARIGALGEAITASTRATERQADVLADLAEVVRASLNRGGG